MPTLITTYGLYDALKAEGYELPDECAGVRLEMPAQGVIQLVLTVNVDGPLLSTISRALSRMAGHPF